mmetsp:Transcript_22758/g.71260  ORF Transcript_22758/g.71260 Transcript_22758/m.71260 type:complete len:382 (+) Transcript_22758:279-1424(+)
MGEAPAVAKEEVTDAAAPCALEPSTHVGDAFSRPGDSASRGAGMEMRMEVDTNGRGAGHGLDPRAASPAHAAQRRPQASTVDDKPAAMEVDGGGGAGGDESAPAVAVAASARGQAEVAGAEGSGGRGEVGAAAPAHLVPVSRPREHDSPAPHTSTEEEMEEVADAQHPGPRGAGEEGVQEEELEPGHGSEHEAESGTVEAGAQDCADVAEAIEPDLPSGPDQVASKQAGEYGMELEQARHAVTLSPLELPAPPPGAHVQADDEEEEDDESPLDPRLARARIKQDALKPTPGEGGVDGGLAAGVEPEDTATVAPGVILHSDPAHTGEGNGGGSEPRARDASGIPVGAVAQHDAGLEGPAPGLEEPAAGTAGDALHAGHAAGL